jgi:hypothetical protein
VNDRRALYPLFGGRPNLVISPHRTSPRTPQTKRMRCGHTWPACACASSTRIAAHTGHLSVNASRACKVCVCANIAGCQPGPVPRRRRSLGTARPGTDQGATVHIPLVLHRKGSTCNGAQPCARYVTAVASVRILCALTQTWVCITRISIPPPVLQGGPLSEIAASEEASSGAEMSKAERRLVERLGYQARYNAKAGRLSKSFAVGHLYKVVHHAVDVAPTSMTHDFAFRCAAIRTVPTLGRPKIDGSRHSVRP